MPGQNSTHGKEAQERGCGIHSRAAAAKGWCSQKLRPDTPCSRRAEQTDEPQWCPHSKVGRPSACVSHSCLLPWHVKRQQTDMHQHPILSWSDAPQTSTHRGDTGSCSRAHTQSCVTHMLLFRPNMHCNLHTAHTSKQAMQTPSVPREQMALVKRNVAQKRLAPPCGYTAVSS